MKPRGLKWPILSDFTANRGLMQHFESVKTFKETPESEVLDARDVLVTSAGKLVSCQTE